MDKNILEFSVNIYGNLEKYNEVLSKGRCRIFYKYGNRNGTYITDDFAEELLSSLPYSPVKGIYEYDDYTDHGTRRSEGRIYGIVPENPNISWESHADEDGVERLYACADVLIFTALYKEAAEIIGKSQSMELYEPSLSYHQEIIDGQKWIVFDKGCFLGLQVLGEDVEPCFEGASFYTLQSSIEDVIKKIEEISNTYTMKGGKLEMHNFKLSDNQKYNALWSLLNTEYTEEGNWTITHTITDVYDEYALVFNFVEGQYERVYYTKDDETESLAIDKVVKVFVVDVTEEEKNTVETLRKLNGDTYELVSETLQNAESTLEKLGAVEEEISVCNSKIVEFEEKVTTLESEKANSDLALSSANETIESLNGAIETLNAENEELKEFKYNVEKQQKEAVLGEYEMQLTEEVLDSYREKIDEYSAIELDKELAYELKKTNPTVFSKEPQSGYTPKDGLKGGIEEILSKYVK